MIPPSPQGSRPTPTPSGNRPSRSRLSIWLTVLVLGLLTLLVITERNAPTGATKTISYATFLSDVQKNVVASVEIDQSSGVITGTFAKGSAFSAQGPTGGLPTSDVSLLDTHHVARSYAPPSSDILGSILSWVIPLALLAGLWIWMSRRAQGQLAGVSNWSKSGAKVHVTEHPSTRFSDVAGYDAVKREIREVVEFLRSPDRFREIGARIPKGMLLVGPPGTGKTLFARAIAGEAGVAFISITGSEFMEMFVGIGAARVRDLFSTARQERPSIVFIDEIDAIGRKRGTGLGGGHDEREQTLNQILSEMDGFEATEGIIVLAATNRPDVLDPALLRAGRFDRQVVIPLPTLEERRQILAVHARRKRFTEDVDLDVVARATPGMSGADLENLLNEAAIIAVRRGAKAIGGRDLDAAHDRVLIGLERTSLTLSVEEKRIVAVHEAGHTLLAELLPHADPVRKVTILPAGLALGATQQLPIEERQIRQRPELEDALAVLLGGRAAEELVFGVPSTGAENDLTRATEIAGRMVREWGMSERIGKMSWASRGPVFLGEDLLHTRDYSDATARVIDEEVSAILDVESKHAHQVLSEHRGALEALADALVRNETLEEAEVREVIDLAESLGPSSAEVDVDRNREALGETREVPADRARVPGELAGNLVPLWTAQSRHR